MTTANGAGAPPETRYATAKDGVNIAYQSA
jgi:hypothetical protein